MVFDLIPLNTFVEYVSPAYDANTEGYVMRKGKGYIIGIEIHNNTYSKSDGGGVHISYKIAPHKLDPYGWNPVHAKNVTVI